MSLPRYPEYKDSGVAWLGEVPAHWEVKRLKLACDIFPSNIDKKSYEDELPVHLCNYTDVYYNEQITEVIDFMPASATKEQVAKFTLRAGDTIITKDSETSDDIAIAAYVPRDLPGIVCGYHLSLVRTKPGTDGRYVKRLFDSHYLKSCFEVLANGLTRVGLSQSALDNVEIPLPESAEQTTIATFLDRETAKIDALVAEQEKLLTLLAEKRQATISHSVTKGLNRNAPMKDSGVEWLGDVPAHWRVSRLKYLVESPNGIQMGPFGGMLLNLLSDDTGYKVYGQENTISGDFSRGNRWISQDRFVELEQYRIQIGDLVLTRKGSLGNARLISSLPQPGIADSDTIRLRVNEELVLPELLAILLHEAEYVARQISVTKRGAILSGLNTETIANLAIVCPPLSEQGYLLESLSAKMASFDAGVIQSTRAIDLLKERRSALISTAVTGKIDVRALAEPEAA